MLNKELPLKTTKDIDKYFSREGTCADVFEFKPENGKKYVYKEVREKSRSIKKTPGETLEEKVSFAKMIYDILIEYFGDRIAKTFFIIANNRFNEKCMMIIQEKINGVAWGDMNRNHKFYEKALGQTKEIEKIIERAENDSRIEKIRHKFRASHNEIYLGSLRFGDILYDENIVVDKEGNVKIIDW